MHELHVALVTRYNYMFILDLTPGFTRLGKDNCKARRETFKFGDVVRLTLEILRYFLIILLFIILNSCLLFGNMSKWPTIRLRYVKPFSN